MPSLSVPDLRNFLWIVAVLVASALLPACGPDDAPPLIDAAVTADAQAPVAPIASPDAGARDADDPLATLPVVPIKVTKADVPAPKEPTGGTGSALAFDPSDGLYWAVTDQAPSLPDGGVQDWPLYLYRVKVDGDKAELVKGVPITDQGKALMGSDLDPEGIAIAPDGTLWLCDEKFPLVFQVDREGHILRRIEPDATLKDRENNRGLEGVAISPDGKTLFAILQNGPTMAKDKHDTVIAAYDLATGAIQHFPYRLDAVGSFDYPKDLMPAPRAGSHDLHPVGPRTLLVLERDNQSDAAARLKRIYKVELPAAPPTTALPKTLVLDLLPLGYRFEAPEGLTMRGPRTLAISNDNDGIPGSPNQIWEVTF